MGKRKSRWLKEGLIACIAIGFLLIGVVVNNYFQSEAGSNSSNHQKNNTINRAFAKGPTPDTLNRNTKDLRLEKERNRKQQEKALNWSNEQARENNSQEPSPTNPATQPPGPNHPVTSQETPNGTVAAPSGQTATQPANSESKKTIYLTFDDGPSPFSSEIIASLENYQYKATFFMIDGNIRKYPEAVKLMVQTGETVGLHSVSHNQKIFYASVDSIIAELTQNRNTLKEISGIDSYIMRTPYGSVPYMTAEYRKAVTDNGYLMWDWNIDSRDWDFNDARYVNSVIEQLSRMADHTGPIIILLHERRATAEHLPQLLDYLTKQGFEGKAIDSSMPAFQFKN